MSFRPFQAFRGFGGMVAGFNALAYGTPLTWLDASSPATLLDGTGNPAAEGAAVATWVARSGRNAATVTTAGRPVRNATYRQNGIAGIYFDGDDDALNLGTNGPTSATIYLIGRRFAQDGDTASSLRAVIANYSVTPSQQGWWASTGRPGGGNGNNVLMCYCDPVPSEGAVAGKVGYGGTEGDWPDNTNICAAFVIKAACEVWKNGALVDAGTTGPTAAPTTAPMWIGGHFEVAARHIKAVFWELLVYSTAHDGATVATISNQLRAKWQLP